MYKKPRRNPSACLQYYSPIQLNSSMGSIFPSLVPNHHLLQWAIYQAQRPHRPSVKFQYQVDFPGQVPLCASAQIRAFPRNHHIFQGQTTHRHRRGKNFHWPIIDLTIIPRICGLPAAHSLTLFSSFSLALFSIVTREECHVDDAALNPCTDRFRRQVSACVLQMRPCNPVRSL